MTTDIPVIAIDGLASSGKTAISRLLSKQLRFYFLDSGVLYRAFAFIAKEKSKTEKKQTRDDKHNNRAVIDHQQYVA